MRRCLLLASALVLATTVVSPSAATAATVTLCSGYTGCAGAGYGDSGYGSSSGTSYWGMDPGHNCTNYAAYRLIQNNVGADYLRGQGNAYQWGGVARSHGVTVDGNPAVGAIAWWNSNAGGHGSLGHVAYVEQVAADGSVLLSEDNFGGDFHWLKMTAGTAPSGFIHFGDVTPPPSDDPDHDGIPSSSDQCPDQAGPASTGGCPDSDGDAVADLSDRCPSVPGSAANRGCPTAGSINGDANADVVMAVPSAPGTVDLRFGLSLGNGYFTLGTAVGLTGVRTPTKVTSGDINGDGRSDVIMVVPATATTVDYLYGLSLGNGHFSLGTAVGLTGQPTPTSVSAGDINGDGRSDIVIGVPGAGGTVDFRYGLSLGDGHFTLGTAVGLTGVTAPVATTVADINGDGRTDIVTAVPISATTVDYLFGLSAGNGHFSLGTAIGMTGQPRPVTLTSGDINGDGNGDVVVAISTAANTVDFQFGLSLGNGHFSLGTAVGLTGVRTPTKTATGDMNGDGRADVLLASPTTSSTVDFLYGLSLGNGHFTMGSAVGLTDQPFPVGVASGVDAGDVVPTLTVRTSRVAASLSVPVALQLRRAGGTARFTWSLASGTPPPGLQLSSSGRFSGKPTSAGTFSMQVSLRDGSGQLARRAITVVVRQR